MGTGHSVDTPIRVAPLGISSVISLVDDILLEKVREHYSKTYNLPYERIAKSEGDGRARRITAYLDAVQEIVRIKFEEIRNLPFFQPNDKRKYFELLPGESPLRHAYEKFLKMAPGKDRDEQGGSITERMTPGSIDVNIMVKLDRVNFGRDGLPLSDEFSDSKAALRGYARSRLRSALVLSAGINQSLFSYIPQFRDFYRDEMGEIKKRIILKVSDFRSALVQAKLMAKKGLEIFEFRIESGLNCGGHAFATNGVLLPTILREFKEKRDQLAAEIEPVVRKFYETIGWHFPERRTPRRSLVTVQGGIGTHGEVRRLREEFGMDLTGWASPFLLVPEATCVDDATRELLRQAKEEDLYMSDVSPLGVPFNNIRRSGSELSRQANIAEGRPGSLCPKGFLVSNLEFSEKPICLASNEYQTKKLEEIAAADLTDAEKEKLFDEITEKSCICDHLGNGALIALGIVKENKAPQAICPGPNIAWFDRIYSLKEMVDHIYGRGPSLVPQHRPHMFAKEIVMYVDYLEKLITRCKGTPKEIKSLEEFSKNLEAGMTYSMEIAGLKSYPDENLPSLSNCVEKQKVRLEAICASIGLLAVESPLPVG